MFKSAFWTPINVYNKLRKLDAGADSLMKNMKENNKAKLKQKPKLDDKELVI